MTLKSELENFTDALADLDNAQAALETLPESDAQVRHLHRILWARNQVESVQNAAVQIGMAMAGLRRGVKVQLPKYAEDTAFYALKGGTAILAGVTYAARQFIHAQQNPDAQPLALGLLAGANWAGLGGLLGSIEGMRK